MSTATYPSRNAELHPETRTVINIEAQPTHHCVRCGRAAFSKDSPRKCRVCRRDEAIITAVINSRPPVRSYV